MEMPLSEDALRFARKLAASKYTYPDDRLAVADLLQRWNLGLGANAGGTPHGVAALTRQAALDRRARGAGRGRHPAVGRPRPGHRGPPSRTRTRSSTNPIPRPVMTTPTRISTTTPRATSTPTPWKMCDGGEARRAARPRSPLGQPHARAQGRLAAVRRCRARIPPESLTRTQLDALGERAVEDYNRQRREWHANLGPIKTPQLAALHEDLWDIVDSNAQDGDKAKGAVAIDAFPGLGKTTSVLAFAKQFHRREIREQGTATGAGHERWPVCRVGLTGNTGMVEFNRAMLAFFAHPGMSRGNAAHFAHRALDCILTCETKLLIVDDLHFLRWRNTVGVEISNHFKYIANEFPVTLIFVGVGLAARGLFSEGPATKTR